MAKSCALCGKSTTFGNNRRHNTTSNISRHGAWGKRAPRTNRTWKANLRKAKITVGVKTVSDWVCMKCYKKQTA